MRVFISWSGSRGRALALALKEWVPKVIPGTVPFHSDDIPKGADWHPNLIAALRDCQYGIFCLTPEGMQSQWLMFEAGALAQHGKAAKYFTYRLGAVDLTDGPLGSAQSTNFDRADSAKFVRDLANALGMTDGPGVSRRFGRTWQSFAEQVEATAQATINELVPGFSSLFARHKTFHEPFPECTDKDWQRRLRRAVGTWSVLSAPIAKDLVAANPRIEQRYEKLVKLLDRYSMHIGSLLLTRVEFGQLPPKDRKRLEDTRKAIVGVVEELTAM